MALQGSQHQILDSQYARSRSRSDQIRGFLQPLHLTSPGRAAWSGVDVRLFACMHGAEVDMKTSPLPNAGLNGIGQPLPRAFVPLTRQASHTGSLRLQQQAIQQANGSTVCCASATEAPASARPQIAEEDFTWKGSDEFSELGQLNSCLHCATSNAGAELGLMQAYTPMITTLHNGQCDRHALHLEHFAANLCHISVQVIERMPRPCNCLPSPAPSASSWCGMGRAPGMQRGGCRGAPTFPT